MRLITIDQLALMMPAAPAATLQKFLEPLNTTMAHFDIDTPLRQAAFLGALVAHETAQLTCLVENLNYSAQGLLTTWPKRFSEQEAQHYQRRPPAIANHAYAQRNGNGEEASGDGWLYRGRGTPMLTGRANYRRCGRDLGLPLEADPALLELPIHAAMCGGWFWQDNNLNRHADRGSVKAITLVLNGGYNGLDERLAFYATNLDVLLPADVA